MIGKAISHYRILEKLGEGGMGEVYLAEDTELDRKVALKFLPPQYTKDPDINVRFKHEAKAAAALNHPNIITVYEIDEHEGRAFIAMEYVEGHTLGTLAKVSNLRKVIDYTMQICEGLAAAHKNGIVHRDIKPDNILINSEGRVKIADFGLAKARGRTKLTEEGSTLGTLDYMSPEQLSGADVDRRTDIWSVGVVLYEMITGRLPFADEYQGAAVYAVMHEEPEPLARYKTGVSEGLQRIMDKALDKDPETRYQNIADLLTDLKREKKSGSEPARRIDKIERKKSKRVVFLSAGLGMGAILVAYFFTNSFQKPTTELAKIAEPIVVQTGPLTTSASIPEVDPDISPDGSKVLYAVNENENWDVWVHEITSGQRLNITKDYNGSDGSARWSPDGNRIAYRSTRDGGGIYLVSEFGGSIRQIVPDYPDGGLNWSFDGKKLVYEVYDTSLSDTLSSFLKTVTVDDGVKRTIPLPHFCRDPAWSPDGSRIVYVTYDDENVQIRTVNVDGVDPAVVFEASSMLFSPLWSSDGNRIFFKWWQKGIRDLWWIPVDKKGNPIGSAKRLTTGWDAFDFSLSRDGTKLAYCKGIQRVNIWSIPLNTDRVLKIDDAIQVTAQNLGIWGLAISPDYEWFAFTSNKSGMIDIWIMRKDGKDQRQLTADSLWESGLCWSPDGSRIAYAGYQHKNADIYAVSITGGVVQPLINHEASDSSPSWSPTGDTIVFESDRSGNSDIWMAYLRDNSVRQLTDHKNEDFLPEFSPDGGSIAFISNRSGAFEIYIMSVETGEKRKLTSIHSDEVLNFVWSQDNKTIYVQNSPRGADRSRKIWKVTVKDGKTRKILDFKGEMAGPLWIPESLARDSERLYFIRAHSAADIWTAQLEYK